MGSPSLPQWPSLPQSLTPTPQLLPPPTPLPQLSHTTATPPLHPLTPMADTPMVDTPPSPPGPSTKSATKDTWAYDKLLLWFLFEWKNPGGFSVRKEPRGYGCLASACHQDQLQSLLSFISKIYL